ncbi:hypothetical protein V8C37DRAFT_395786 [Trichoderma ceciliae]
MYSVQMYIYSYTRSAPSAANLCIMPEPEGIKQGLKPADTSLTLGASYALQHATKSNTVRPVLAAGPISLLA